MGWGNFSPQDYDLDSERRDRVTQASERQRLVQGPTPGQASGRIRGAFAGLMSWRSSITQRLPEWERAPLRPAPHHMLIGVTAFVIIVASTALIAVYIAGLRANTPESPDAVDTRIERIVSPQMVEVTVFGLTRNYTLHVSRSVLIESKGSQSTVMRRLFNGTDPPNGPPAPTCTGARVDTCIMEG